MITTIIAFSVLIILLIILLKGKRKVHIPSPKKATNQKLQTNSLPTNYLTKFDDISHYTGSGATDDLTIKNIQTYING